MKTPLFMALAFATLSGGPVYAQETNMKIKITTEAKGTLTKAFTATLLDSPTANAFKSMLPLTLDMADLHGNEKKYDLPNRVPTKDTNPKRIEAGDLMIWNSRTVVLFYESFPTSYSYTKLGQINDASDLAKAVGSGNVKVTFELQ